MTGNSPGAPGKRSGAKKSTDQSAPGASAKPEAAPEAGIEDAKRDGEKAKAAIEREADAARAELSDVRDAVSEKVSEFAAEGRATALRQGETAKNSAADGLKTVANAIRGAGDDLDGGNQSAPGQMLNQAASSLEDFSSALANRSVGELIDDVRSFGRSNPTAFVLGSVLAGVAIGRFARSSAVARRDDETREARSTEPGPDMPSTPNYSHGGRL